MRRAGFLISIALLAVIDTAFAQQSNDQYFQEQQQRQQQAFGAEQARQGYEAQQFGSQPSTGEWKTTWGAIATDNEKGVLGAVVGQADKDCASAAALADCQVKGGVRCKVDLAYFNQCPAMVMGDREYRLYGAATVEEAAQRGLKICGESDSHCRLYYSDCTKPEFVQY